MRPTPDPNIHERVIIDPPTSFSTKLGKTANLKKARTLQQLSCEHVGSHMDTSKIRLCATLSSVESGVQHVRHLNEWVELFCGLLFLGSMFLPCHIASTAKVITHRPSSNSQCGNYWAVTLACGWLETCGV